MSPLSCQQVTEQIELYVAGECAEPERSAIRQHLLQCRACARMERETRELLGLLELRLQESDRLGRMQAVLRMEEKHKQPRKVLPFARRAAAVAAMLLVAAGLSLWFRGQSPSDGYSNPLVVALGPVEAGRNAAPFLLKQEPAIAPAKVEEKTQVFALDLKDKTAAQFRHQIEKAERLPQPPRVNLGLEIRNSSAHEVKIFVGGKGSELTMNLTGPGAMTAAAPANFQADFLVPQTINLPANHSHVLAITYLVYGNREKLHAAYWTEPGQYTLTLRYKVAIADARGQDLRFVTLRSPPMQMQVQLKGK